MLLMVWRRAPPLAAEGLAREAAWTRLRDLVSRLLRVMHDGGVFAAQAAEHARYCFSPALFGLDVLIDRDGRPWLLECQRNPAMTGNPLTNRINAGLFAPAFRMSVFCLLDHVDDDPALLADEARRRTLEETKEMTIAPKFERVTLAARLCRSHHRARLGDHHAGRPGDGGRGRIKQ
jgi:hypothetical protein